MPLPLLAIFGASLVIGTLVVVALLKWREIVNWFRNKGALKQSDKDNIAVIVKTQLATGHVREIHGIFNTRTEEVLDGQQYEAKELDQELQDVFGEEDVVVLS